MTPMPIWKSFSSITEKQGTSKLSIKHYFLRVYQVMFLLFQNRETENLETWKSVLMTQKFVQIMIQSWPCSFLQEVRLAFLCNRGNNIETSIFHGHSKAVLAVLRQILVLPRSRNAPRSRLMDDLCLKVTRINISNDLSSELLSQIIPKVICSLLGSVFVKKN